MNHLIEVAPHTFLNKNDSLFIQKYLRYHPKGDNMVYHYAKELMAKGKTEQALSEYHRAANMGNANAKTYLAKIAKSTVPVVAVRAVSLKRNIVPTWVLWALLVLAAVMLLLSLAGLLDKLFDDQENKTVVHKSETIALEEDAAPNTKPVVAALSNYKADHGNYPESLDALKAYLPQIPSGISYEKTPNGYMLTAKGGGTARPVLPVSLLFYQDAGKLALQRGEEVWAIYPVAFGETTGDVPQGEVTQKVINPNGGNGVFGTRGLVLAKNIAIHGTNDPSSIGQKVTKGCLRMLNSDIENLYPYVSVGTPYTIVSGQPKDAKYGSAMPALQEPQKDVNKEETPEITYHWRQ